MKIFVQIQFVLILFMFLPQIIAGQSESDTLESGWGAYPVVFYTDPTSLAFGGYGIHYFNIDKAKYTSDLNLALIYTLKKQIIIEVGGDVYWQDRRFSTVINYLKYPNIYYGIGNDTQADSSEEYTDEGVTAILSFQQEILPNLFAGMIYNFQSHALIETDLNGTLTLGILPGTESPFRVSGIGVTANYDTRNNVNYTTLGSFFKISWLYYTRSIGSDFNYVRTEIDIRRYFPYTDQGAIGFQGTWTNVTSGSPILTYPVLGDDRLRGFAARYWDRNLITLQMEYRKIAWGDFGFAVFAGVGEVARRVQDFTLQGIKFGIGIGLRYMILPEAQMNIRVDFGLGTYGNSSLTFINGEAF